MHIYIHIYIFTNIYAYIYRIFTNIYAYIYRGQQTLHRKPTWAIPDLGFIATPWIH